MRNWTASAAIILAGCMGLGCGPVKSNQPEVWRFAIEETQGSVQDAYAQYFKQRVEEATDGAVEVIVYPYGTLGTSDHVTEQLAMGAIEFAMASPGHIGTLIPEAQALLLHFILTDDEELNRQILEDPEVVGIFDKLYAEKNFRLLSIFSEGWMVWTTRRPVRRLEDFDGVKIRVMTSPLLIAAYEAYGATPTPLPYGEVYSALQLNMIDAQVNPVFAIQEMSFYEVTDYMIFARHAPFIATSVTNQTFYENMSPEHRDLVDSIVDELNMEVFKTQRQFNEERLEMILERKPELEVIEKLEDKEWERFREASVPVRDKFLELAGPRGQEVLDAIENAKARILEAAES